MVAGLALAAGRGMAAGYEQVPAAEVVGAGEPAERVAAELGDASDPTPDAPSSTERTKKDVKKARSKSFFQRWRIAYARTVRDILRHPRVNQAMDFGMRAFSFVAKYVVGPCLVCVALGLIGFVTHTFFVHVIPLKQQLGSSSLDITIRSCLGVFLLVNGLYNYIMTIFTDPGYPPEFAQALEECKEGAPQPRQCSRCTKAKPVRCHHCSVCRRCVLKMDHHCPWVNTCVGHGNYRHFLLFMMYIFLCCLFVIANMLPHFMEIVMHRRRMQPHGTREGRQAIMTGFMISASITCSLLILGGFHTFLCATNQTTIEFQDNFVQLTHWAWKRVYYRNPYDIGVVQNFQSVFGPNAFFGCRWFMPYIAAKPTGSGLEWPTRHSLELDSVAD